MDFSTMTMTQKKTLGAAAACLIFVIATFLPWFKISGFGESKSFSAWTGNGPVPSPWIWLIFGLAAAALLVMTALDMDIPIPVPPLATAFYLISVPFWLMLAMLFDGDYPSKQFGLFLGLLATLAAAVLTLMVGREEEA